MAIRRKKYNLSIGTEGFHKKGKLVRVRNTNHVVTRPDGSGQKLASRHEAARRLKGMRNTMSKKNALKLKRHWRHRTETGAI